MKNAKNDGLFDEIAKIEDNEPEKIKHKKEWLGIFEKFCWGKWDNEVLKLEYPKLGGFYPKKDGKLSNNCDHNDGYLEGADSGDYFYYDALSSQGQSKLPNYNGKLSTYISTYKNDIIIKTKVGESIYSRILVFDERIQENAKETYLEIPISKLYEMTGVLVPTINLSAQTLDKCIILKEIRKHIAFDIDKYCEGFKEEQSILNAYFDFILIHYSILERIFDSNKNQINDFLIELSKTINVVITSGRGEPEDLPKQVRFINLSTVVHSLVETRSKYFTNYIMHASRKSSKSK